MMWVFGRTKKQVRLPAAWIALGLAWITLPSCINSRSVNGLGGSQTGTTPPSTSVPGLDSYVISRVTVAQPASAGSPAVASVFFDTAKSTAPVTNHCNTASSGVQTAKPCSCNFQWQQINQTSGQAVAIPRSVQTSVTNAQASIVTCNMPTAYTSAVDMPEGTPVNISLVPAAGNNDSYTSTLYQFTKSSAAASGSFQDSQGHFFDNILRYACYQELSRGMSIISKQEQAQDPISQNLINYPSASKFCVQKINGGAQGAGCQNLPPPDFSAQSYYYNFYIRDSESGGINFANAKYICPKVVEALRGSSLVGQKGTAWPLDTSFALSLGPSATFNVGVEANTKIAGGANDASSVGSVCDPTKQAPQVDPNTGIVPGCLGFAAKPSADGTCPYFKDSSGKTVLTYRLRRFVTIYPPIFDTDGNIIAGRSQSVDTIYVLDRPVNSAAADPLKPYTMRGPKPCPFAYFDSKGVTGVADPSGGRYPGNLPTYAATNNSAWNGTNIDGTQLPNVDASINGQFLSCSAVIPLFSPSGIATIATVNSTNPLFKQVYIRPVKAWAPHYEEDTAFQACAPQANPMKDPPLHFAKDPTTGNVNWCAEAYPTQNDNVSALDSRDKVFLLDTTKPLLGYVAPFTSHVKKNSLSAPCSATIPSSIPGGAKYPNPTGNVCGAAGTPQALARHPADFGIDNDPSTGGLVCAPNTCDRTVSTPSLTWTRFPLLARPSQVESAISSDSTYGCTVTYDNTGGKTGKITPSGGCCGPSVFLRTGLNAGNFNNAHLEPDVACQVPNY